MSEDSQSAISMGLLAGNGSCCWFQTLWLSAKDFAFDIVLFGNSLPEHHCAASNRHPEVSN